MKTIDEFDYTLAYKIGVRAFQKLSGEVGTENIDYGKQNCKKIDKEELKQSGIEDIKEFEKYIKEERKEMKFYEYDDNLVNKAHIMQAKHTIEYIKKKFNITESDLK